jgi:hypothetical protein
MFVAIIACVSARGEERAGWPHPRPGGLLEGQEWEEIARQLTSLRHFGGKKSDD